jgi:hypothetical protein
VLRIKVVAGLAAPIALVGVLLLSDQLTRTSDAKVGGGPIIDSRGQQRSVAIDESDTRRPVVATSANSETVSVNIAKVPRPLTSAGPQRIENNLATDQDDRPLGWVTFEEAEQRFGIEQRDAAWSETAEAGILGNLSLVPDLGLVQVDVECRVTLCRLRLLFPPGTETTYAIRRIYALAENIGLGPVSADTGIGSGNLPILRLFLRRKAV